MKGGTKRIELRLYDEKRSQIQLGDIIEFSKSENDKLKAEVIGLLRYNSFKDLFEDFDISILADASMTKEELLNAISEFYTSEKQAQYGVVGIRLKLLQKKKIAPPKGEATRKKERKQETENSVQTAVLTAVISAFSVRLLRRFESGAAIMARRDTDTPRR